ncbi:MAG: hypothetical protein RR101_10820 [Burkholderiaceae bacterium]
MAEVGNFIEMQRQLNRCQGLGIQADFMGQCVVLFGGGCESLRFHAASVDSLKSYIDGYERAISAR